MTTHRSWVLPRRQKTAEHSLGRALLQVMCELRRRMFLEIDFVVWMQWSCLAVSLLRLDVVVVVVALWTPVECVVLVVDCVGCRRRGCLESWLCCQAIRRVDVG